MACNQPLSSVSLAACCPLQVFGPFTFYDVPGKESIPENASSYVNLVEVEMVLNVYTLLVTRCGLAGGCGMSGMVELASPHGICPGGGPSPAWQGLELHTASAGRQPGCISAQQCAPCAHTSYPDADTPSCAISLTWQSSPPTRLR